MYWTIVFSALALATGLFAFGGVAASAAGAAQIVFYVCLLISLIALLSTFTRKRE